MLRVLCGKAKAITKALALQSLMTMEQLAILLGSSQGRSYEKIPLDVVSYFKCSPLWHVLIVSNNPLRNGKLREIVGEENVFVPDIRKMMIPYKTTSEAVSRVKLRIQEVQNEAPLNNIFMTGDRVEDSKYLAKIIHELDRKVPATFIKLPESLVLRSPLRFLIP